MKNGGDPPRDERTGESSEADARLDGQASRSASADDSGSTPAQRGSRHYRRAQRDRGAETRAQLIEAALDVFGRLGFEGASTREIARAAKANLAAIVYHFGSKEALHLAVAEHVANRISAHIAPILAEAELAGETPPPEVARDLIRRLIETMADLLLGSAEAERWARFIVREQMQPTAAFDVIYRFLGGAAATGSRLIAAARQTPESQDTKLRTFTLMGQMLVFRFAETLVLRRMDWQEIGDRERTAIKRIVIENVETILRGDTP